MVFFIWNRVHRVYCRIECQTVSNLQCFSSLEFEPYKNSTVPSVLCSFFFFCFIPFRQCCTFLHGVHRTKPYFVSFQRLTDKFSKYKARAIQTRAQRRLPNECRLATIACMDYYYLVRAVLLIVLVSSP